MAIKKGKARLGGKGIEIGEQLLTNLTYAYPPTR